MFTEESVRATLVGTGYPEQRLHLVRGPVEETLVRVLEPDRRRRTSSAARFLADLEHACMSAAQA